MKHLLFISTVILVMSLGISSAQAHMLWLNADNYSPRPGDPVSIGSIKKQWQ